MTFIPKNALKRVRSPQILPLIAWRRRAYNITLVDDAWSDKGYGTLNFQRVRRINVSGIFFLRFFKGETVMLDPSSENLKEQVANLNLFGLRRIVAMANDKQEEIEETRKVFEEVFAKKPFEKQRSVVFKTEKFWIYSEVWDDGQTLYSGIFRKGNSWDRTSNFYNTIEEATIHTIATTRLEQNKARYFADFAWNALREE